MPLSGTIVADVEYTLIEDCVLTDTILISGGSASSDVEMTVNGGTNTITLSNSGASVSLFNLQAASNWTTTVNLKNLTIDLENIERLDPINVAGTLNLSNLTLKGLDGYFGTGSGPFIVGAGTSTRRASINLNSVLVADNSSAGFSHTLGGNILRLNQYTDATLHNVVIRNNYWDAAAIGVGTGSTLTATGCLTFSGIIPRNVKGNWTDNSTGACSGTVGNNGNAALPAPQRLACGFPSTTNFDQNASFNLIGNCVIAGTYNLTQGVTVRINGNGHTMTSDGTTPATFQIANEASLILNNIHSANIAYVNFGTLRGTRVHAKDFNRTTVIDNQGTADFSDSIFSDNVGSYSAGVALAAHYYGNGATGFTNTVFRNNTGGRAALRQTAAPATLTLNGCITFENNSPADTVGTIVNNSTGSCQEDTIGPGPPTIPREPPSGPPAQAERPAAPRKDHDRLDCHIPLGAIGLICRGKDGDEPILEVWEISPESVGSFALGIRQKQVEAAGQQGIFLCSANGRAGIRVSPLPAPEVLEIWRWDPRYPEEINVPRTYITVSVGPNFEGKVHHVILDHTLEGRVLSMVSTYDRLEDCAEKPAPPQNQQLHNCMVTTKYILNFRADPADEIIGVVPYNITLTALERTDGWFKVDYHGARGWLSADYLTPVGSCG